MMSKNPAGEGRYRKRIDVKDSACVTEIIDNLNDFFKNFNGTPDNKISNILTYNYSGSNIQPHQDDYGATQLRVNIIIEKDELSGNPVINGFLYKIKEKGGWIFSPSSSLHGSTKINNDIRINLSLGWNFVNIEDYINAFVSISTK